MTHLEILYQIRKLLIDYSTKHNIKFHSIDKTYKKSLKLNEDYEICELNKSTINNDLFNNNVLNHEVLNHEVLNHEVLNHEVLNHDVLNHEESKKQNIDYHGVTYVNTKDWISYKQGLRIADIDTLSIDRSEVSLKFKDGKKIPIEIVIHTFLHELAHTVTIPEQRISKTINKRTKALQSHIPIKKNKGFIPCHHSENFYKNFATILRMAEQLNIYILPQTHKNFNIRNLQRYDCMFSPSDKLSVGISPLYK